MQEGFVKGYFKRKMFWKCIEHLIPIKIRSVEEIWKDWLQGRFVKSFAVESIAMMIYRFAEESV